MVNLSISTLLNLVLYLAKSNLQFTSSDATSPIIGIVFCLIIVRVELSVSHRSSSEASTSESHRRSFPFFGHSDVGSRKENVYSLQVRSLAVNVTEGVKVDNNSDYLVDEDNSNVSIAKNPSNLGP